MTHKDKEEKRYLHEELEGDCVEMEGAAVAQVCHMNTIPHVIIRSVSDKADGSAVADYDKFRFIVAENSFKIVDHMLRKL